MTVPPVATPSILNADIPFEVVSDFEPAGDQPEAIKALAEGIENGERFQTLLGITGSGKPATTGGGYIITEGPPELIVAHPDSRTG